MGGLDEFFDVPEYFTMGYFSAIIALLHFDGIDMRLTTAIKAVATGGNCWYCAMVSNRS
jgi:hypothetical protein